MLEALKTLQDHARAAEIRMLAASLLQKPQTEWQAAAQWEVLGQVIADPMSIAWETPLAQVADDSVQAITPRWKELAVGSQIYRIKDVPPKSPPR